LDSGSSIQSMPPVAMLRDQWNEGCKKSARQALHTSQSAAAALTQQTVTNRSRPQTGAALPPRAARRFSLGNTEEPMTAAPFDTAVYRRPRNDDLVSETVRDLSDFHGKWRPKDERDEFRGGAAATLEHEILEKDWTKATGRTIKPHDQYKCLGLPIDLRSSETAERHAKVAEGPQLGKSMVPTMRPPAGTARRASYDSGMGPSNAKVAVPFDLAEKLRQFDIEKAQQKANKEPTTGSVFTQSQSKTAGQTTLVPIAGQATVKEVKRVAITEPEKAPTVSVTGSGAVRDKLPNIHAGPVSNLTSTFSKRSPTRKNLN